VLRRSLESESFFTAQKSELVHRTVFPTLTRARHAIAEYIEVFTNRSRLQSRLGYKTPPDRHPSPGGRHSPA